MTKPTITLSFPEAVELIRAGERTAESAARTLVSQLTDRELLWLLDGDVPLSRILSLPKLMQAGPISGGAIKRLGIPGIRFSDGPRGVIMNRSTAFPVTMARGATWDPELERRVGRAMGLEARAQGANYSGAICVNLLRHPAWGRAQECYGEDPVLTGRLGVALTSGLQENVMGCVKHFALNSMENMRFKIDVTAEAHALHEVYLPHFKSIIDSGADSVMSSYNSVNGTFMGENRVLLTDILRDEWGFEGFVTSDWAGGTHDAIVSLEAGMDIEMPLRMHRARELPRAVREGRLSKRLVLKSAHRIIERTLVRYSNRSQTEPPVGIVAGPEHRALAREVASSGMVLLQNTATDGRPLLPLHGDIRRIAVIGALAVEGNTGDHGSSYVRPPSTCSPLEGLRTALPSVRVEYIDGSDIPAAARAAAAADIAVVVAGMSFDDEGERIQNEAPDPDDPDIFGWPLNTAAAKWLLARLVRFIPNPFGRGGDRESLTLHSHDEDLIEAVAGANHRTAVVMIGGSAIMTERWRKSVPAILMAWYPGMEGGHALADVLTGKVEPGGRLPFSIATDQDHLAYFDASARHIVYDEWWGQRMLDRDGHPAAFPFGFGLGYTTFDVQLVDHSTTGVDGTATVHLRNTGARSGSTVAQVYAVNLDDPRPVPRLLGFERKSLEPGAESVLTVNLDLGPVRERDPMTRSWTRRPGIWQILVAQHSPSDFQHARPLFVDGESSEAGRRPGRDVRKSRGKDVSA